MSLLLAVNVGSTSLKAKIFEMPSEVEVAKIQYAALGTDRASSTGAFSRAGEIVERWSDRLPRDTSLAEALDGLVFQLRTFLLAKKPFVAVAYKVVAARGFSGVTELTADVQDAIRQANSLYPAHNEPYLLAIRKLMENLPDCHHVGVFETSFFDSMPEASKCFAIPRRWIDELGVRKLGFHGASHSWVAAEIVKNVGQCRHVSCHLGGSSSVAAISGGQAVGSSWGMSTQSGIPHAHRVGDFDVHAAAFVAMDLGLGWDAVLRELAQNAGLQGLSGASSGDLRDIRQAALLSTHAQVALNVFEDAVVKAIGQSAAHLSGLDVLTFSGGIGENDYELVQTITSRVRFLGLDLLASPNPVGFGIRELTAPKSLVRAFIVETNEEQMVARHAYDKISNGNWRSR